MARTGKLFNALSRRGPHKVLRGDLAFAGLPGVVYTPESGLSLAGVAFGHDWLTAVDRYLGTLEHLASWGIVAAAPDTERGLAPSASRLAFDLGTTLDIIAGVRLGPGKISVHPAKLGVIGHGFGGSAAVLTAAKRQGTNGFVPKAAAAAFPSIVKPPAEEAATGLHVPGLLLSAPGDPTNLRSNTPGLSRAWEAAVLRVVSKAKPSGFAEGRRLMRAFGLPGPNRRTQRRVRALLTGFLLYQLTGDKTYRQFADPDAHLPGTDPLDGPLEPAPAEEKFVALLK
ncbi:MAG TPA: hypothetical protein VMU34_11480 [Mycobacterium sp.]|nr:hypothetical protein [Mycobacterium sp.]